MKVSSIQLFVLFTAAAANTVNWRYPELISCYVRMLITCAIVVATSRCEAQRRFAALRVTFKRLCEWLPAGGISKGSLMAQD